MAEGAAVVAAVAVLQALGDYTAHLTGLPPFVGQVAGALVIALERWIRASPWAKNSNQQKGSLSEAVKF